MNSDNNEGEDKHQSKHYERQHPKHDNNNNKQKIIHNF